MIKILSPQTNSKTLTLLRALLKNKQGTPTCKLPTIWIGEYINAAEFRNDKLKDDYLRIAHCIENNCIQSLHPYQDLKYCVVCEKPMEMNVDFRIGGKTADGAIINAWTETFICPGCGLNSRKRAFIDFLRNKITIPVKNAYIAEALTPGYKILKFLLPDTIGSEYLGKDKEGGKFYECNGKKLMHQDLTNLSFADKSFDLVASHHVLEHIYDYKKALMEMFRILINNGRLIFSIPNHLRDKTVMRAYIDESGKIHHILPQEIHGNPIDSEGSLCFYNFGWDIIETLQEVGFREACAFFYHSCINGHYATDSNFIFSACK
jgi:SAM-dependent methyltransferase